MRRRTLLAGGLAAIASLVGLPAHAAEPAPPPNVMAATGDSISRGFDAAAWPCFLTDCPQYSWSTGTAVNSHYVRLVALNPALRGRNFNDARTGAKMNALGGQLAAAASQGADYVTVLMGANDLCTSSPATMTSSATFTAQFREALGAYFSKRPSSRVFVSSIPNLYQLWSVLKSNYWARATWSTFGICQSMLSPWNTEAARQQVVQREKELNTALGAVCAEFAGCRFDNLATDNIAFTAADVSTVDYFHPSRAGQQKLANVSWAASYWGG